MPFNTYKQPINTMIVTAYFQNMCFGITGENQVDRMRNEFFKNILRQEIGWYDTSNPLQMTERLAQVRREGGGGEGGERNKHNEHGRGDVCVRRHIRRIRF
jgi:hypothetical protein